MNEAPHILLIYPYSNIGSNPTMQYLALCLAKVCELDIVLVASDGTFVDSTLPCTSFPTDHNFFHLPASRAIRLVRLFRSLWNKNLDRLTFELRSRSKYSLVIGVDPQGAATAHELSATFGIPLSCISFELLLTDETESHYEKTLKAKEAAAHRASEVILIQDTERGRLLCADNNVSEDRLAYVPVAPANTPVVRSKYLHEKFELPTSSRIVLQQGSLYSWSCRDEIDELISYWPSQFVLVIQSNKKLGNRMQKFFQGMENRERIRICEGAVSHDNLVSITASADIGLASYKPSPDDWTCQDNLRYLGLASGKVGWYTMCGLPLLSRAGTSLAAKIETYGIGCTYKRLADAGNCLLQIEANYETYAMASRTFYENVLDPKLGMDAYVQRLLNCC